VHGLACQVAALAVIRRLAPRSALWRRKHAEARRVLATVLKLASTDTASPGDTASSGETYCPRARVAIREVLAGQGARYGRLSNE
jgi:hypothetical protein